MVFIYILQLEEGKYYVGKTSNPEVRIEDHFNEACSVWTKKYNPVSVIKIIPDCDDYDEDKYTVQSMGDYGIDNVRGGSFCQVELSDQNWSTLVQMIHGATNRCYNCGGGHYVKDCPKERDKERDKERPKEQVKENYKKPLAERLEEPNENEMCDCITSYFPHRKRKCLMGNVISILEELTDYTCYRCGRYGHYQHTCYALRHKNGKRL
jgi:hypothetical protein